MANEKLSEALENQDLFSMSENTSDNNPDASKESLSELTKQITEEYKSVSEEEKPKEDVTEENEFESIDQFGLNKKASEIEEKQQTEANIQFIEVEEVTDGVKKDASGNIVHVDFTKLDVDQVINAEVKVLTYNPNLIPEKLKSIAEILEKEEITEKKDKDAIYSVRMDLRTARLDLKKETDFTISKWEKVKRGVKDASDIIQSNLSDNEAKLKVYEDKYDAYKEAENIRKEEERQSALKKRVDELTSAGLYFDDESSMYVCGLVAIDMVTIEKNSDKKHKELLSKIEEQFTAEEEKRKAVEQAKKEAEEAQAEADKKAQEAEEKAKKEAEESKKANLQMRSMLMTANQLIQVEEQFQYNGKDIISVEEVSSASNDDFMKFVSDWMIKKNELDREKEEQLRLEAEEKVFYSRLQRMKDVGFVLENNDLFYRSNYSVIEGGFKNIKTDEDFESFFQSKKEEIQTIKKEEEAILSNVNYLVGLGFKKRENDFIFESVYSSANHVIVDNYNVFDVKDLFSEEYKVTIEEDIFAIKTSDEKERKRIESEQKRIKLQAEEDFKEDIKNLAKYAEQVKAIEVPEFKNETIKDLVSTFLVELDNMLTK